jgi:hypothetical protein
VPKLVVFVVVNADRVLAAGEFCHARDRRILKKSLKKK